MILYTNAAPRYKSMHIAAALFIKQEQFNTQAYFGDRRMLRTGFVFDEPLRTPTYSIKFHTQAYRSGHNEAVLKTVCLTGTGVRIPQPAPKNTNFSVGVFLFFIWNLCAVTTGEERKTVDNCFSRTKSTKQGVGEASVSSDNQRLCDLTGHVVLKTVCPKGTGVRIPLPAPNKRTTEPKKLGCFFISLTLVREVA